MGLVDAVLFESAITDGRWNIAAGSTLVLYTDGLTEAPNAEEKEFGGARWPMRCGPATRARRAQINDSILQAVEQVHRPAGVRDELHAVDGQADVRPCSGIC